MSGEGQALAGTINVNVVVDTTCETRVVNCQDLVVNVVVVVNKGLQLDVTLSPRGEKGGPIPLVGSAMGRAGGSTHAL